MDAGNTIGDIDFKSSTGSGVLLPISYGKYYVLDESLKISKIQQFATTYKQQLRLKWAKETGVSNLSEPVLASIDKINWTNIPGFIFRDSMKTDFGSAIEHDWLFFKAVRSISDPLTVALVLDGDAEQWDKKKWDEKYCNMPPLAPESTEISEMRESLKFVSSQGHMFVDDDEKQHFILDSVYKDLFAPELWRLKKKNDAVYRAPFEAKELEKHEFRDKDNNHLFPV